MTARRITISLFFITLLGMTGAKVGALWSLQSEGEIVTQPRPSLTLQENNLSPVSPVSAQNQAILDRLDQRQKRNPDDHEASLLTGLLLFQGGDVDAAINELSELAQRAPQFKLAHLILGDLLIARFDQLKVIGGTLAETPMSSVQHQRLSQLQSEARVRLQGYLSLTEGQMIPRNLMALSSQVKHALVVDKSKNRLYVYRNAGTGLPPQPVDDFYIVLGKKTGDKMYEGDLKTPNGVYFVTSYLPDERLPALYGSGAFPVNYPNELDRRLTKTGGGIWLHGTEKSLYSRPPLDSEGCVVLTNEEFSRIAQYVETGKTPVIINESVDWISSREWLDANIELQSALETWRQNWEKANLDSYLDMYSRDFWANGHDNSSWKKYKKQIFAGKTYQKIDLSELSLLAYPRHEKGPLVVANFVQHYRSNNFNGDMQKRLYLVKEQNRWKVLYEGRQ